MNFTMIPVTSSNIEAVGHDVGTLTMAVRFANGKTYHYPGVTREAFESFVGAKSIGSYFATNIRPNYTGVLQAEPKPEPKAEPDAEEVAHDPA